MSARAYFKIHVIIIFKDAIAEKLVREGHHFIHFSIHGIFRTDNDSVTNYSQILLDLILLVNEFLQITAIEVHWNLLENFEIP